MVAFSDALERDGYTVVRGVFSAAETAEMRSEVVALLSSPEVRPLCGGLCVGPVPGSSDLARRLLGDARLASPCGGELPSQIHVHADTHNDWHADAPSRMRVSDGALAWAYSTVIYLQDHPHRDGFSVIPGSHKAENISRAPSHVSTRAGDIVIFNHSVRHAGRLPNLTERLADNIADCLYRLRLVGEVGRQRLLRSFRRLQNLFEPAPASKRLAIFLLFATHAEICQRYAALSLDPQGIRPLPQRLYSSLKYIMNGNPHTS